MSDIDIYFKLMIESERTAKLFGAMIKKYLTKSGIAANHSQIYILHIIKQAGKSATVGDIQDILHGIMTNGSYNFGSLIRNGYVLSTLNKLDKRSSYLSLTPKGENLHKDTCSFIESQIKSMEEKVDWDQSNSAMYLSDLKILQSFLKGE